MLIVEFYSETGTGKFKLLNSGMNSGGTLHGELRTFLIISRLYCV